MYININQLIGDKNTRKNGSDFISITKIITNENMGKENRFTEADIKIYNLKHLLKELHP
jgi:hypothetical protein